MPEIIFRKRRGIMADLFAVLCMYSMASTLPAFFRGYNIKPSEELCDSYARIYDFIDKNVKELKPFFIKSADSPEEGSIFHKMTQMLIVKEDLTINDLMNFFYDMSPQYFLAEIFRITDNQPESERGRYLRLIKSHEEVVNFLKTHNYTSRERCAIKYFYEDGDIAYEKFVSFIEKLYHIVEREHNVNDVRLSRYIDWLQYKLIPGREGYLFESESFLSRIKLLSDKIIVTVCLFPPYSVNCLDGDKISTLCFGIGAFSSYAESYYRKQDMKRENPCAMRVKVLFALANGPKRLLDIANEIGTSSADVSYHIGALEKISFIKRVRVGKVEHFQLIGKGLDFVNENKTEMTGDGFLLNG